MTEGTPAAWSFKDFTLGDDLEGSWTYIYFSHNRATKECKSYLQYQNSAPQMLEMASNVPEFEGFRWKVAGKSFYTSINAIFFRLYFKGGPGGHIDNID